jgi:hypothetical protein
MKSPEVYGTLRRIIDPWSKSSGFKRKAGGMLSYLRPVAEAFETFWFQCAQGGWDQYTGSQFTLEFQAADDPSPGNGSSRCRFPGVMTPEELEQVRFLQNVVIRKLRPPPPDHWAHTLPGDTRKWYFARFDLIREPFQERSDIWLRYVDEADVRRWGEFILPLLPGFLARFEERVNRTRDGA